MAIAFDQSFGGSQGTSSTATLASVAPAGTNRLLIVQINSTATIGTPSFGGSSFTQIASTVNTADGNQNIATFYLIAPSTSSGSITCSLGSSQFWWIGAVSYTGIDQTTPIVNSSSNVGATNGGYSPSSPLAVTITSNLDGSWAFISAKQDSGGTVFTAGSNTVQRTVTNKNTNSLFDGNATVANGATHTLNVNFTSGGQKIGWQACMLRPAITSIAYTLAVTVGTFTFTGIDVVFTRGYTFVANVTAFTLTGIDVAFNRGKLLVADVGTFVLTGIDASFHLTLTMATSVGTFLLTGSATGFSWSRTLVADVGTFALTGIDVMFSVGRTMSLTVGSFALTGIDVAFSYGRHMAVTVGTFILTGYPVKFPLFWRTPNKTATAVVADATKHVGTWLDADKTNTP